MKLGVLALDDVFDTGLTAVLNAINTANDVAAQQDPHSRPVDLRVVEMKRQVRTALGMRMSVEAPSAADGFDRVIVPALGGVLP
ncbi:hypothetical protein [Paraburkholderia sp. BR14320]|uniref:hypothetical protein n=1 Tax=unclassified Paraburkholderia TaxID=2615204 RepID=UPI0034CEAA67